MPFPPPAMLFPLFIPSASCSCGRAFVRHWGASDNSVWLGEGQETSSQSALSYKEVVLVFGSQEKKAGAQCRLVESVTLERSLN